MTHSSATVAEILFKIRTELANLSDAPAYEARRLMAYGLEQPINWLYTHPEYRLTITELEKMDNLLAQRCTGYPLAYLLGEWGFYHWDFKVTEHTLIPRPETELLVQEALDWAKSYLAEHDTVSIIDVGTGSGIIGISMALSLPQSSVLAVDISAKALVVAQSNAKNLDAKNIQFQPSNLLEDVEAQKFNLILANLPYIRQDKLPDLDVTRYEPSLALDGGVDGLDLIKILLQQANDYLADGGAIFLEMGAEQGQAVADLAKAEFRRDSQINIIQDLGEHDRIVKITTSH